VELFRDIEKVDPRFRGGVLSVGVFDGVHLGHQKVLGRTVERARRMGVAPVVFTFHPHPADILRPGTAPPLLQTFGRKLETMRELGVAAVVWPDAAEAVLSLTPEAFVGTVVVGALEARAVVEGEDFRFGHGASGDQGLLMGLARSAGFDVEFVTDVVVDGERVSSTRIRRLIADGRVADAARCLGRPYTYVGTVVEGRHRGARLGYPTVNVDAPRFLVPAEGVYAGRAVVRGEARPAAVSIGRAPTFEGAGPVVVEAYLLDFEGELYGVQVAIEFIEYLRAQRSFDAPDALQRQMEADCRRVREALAE